MRSVSVCHMDGFVNMRLKSPHVAVRASGLLIDTPTALIQPTLGAGKGDKTRYGLILHIAQSFEGESSVTRPLGCVSSDTDLGTSRPNSRRRYCHWSREINH